MKHFLIVVDLQNDFVDGALGTKEAEAIVERAAEKIERFDGQIIATLDTHSADYLQSAEGAHLPVVHCVRETAGWQLNARILAALEQRGYTAIEKPTFGSTELPSLIEELAAGEDFTLELIGLCTDICVVSNALLLKAFFHETPIAVDAACCAGVTPESHAAALKTMAMCQIEIENGEN